MGFSGILIRVEDGPDGDRGASNHPEIKYRRWRMTVKNRYGDEQSALTGRQDLIQRAREMIGTAVIISRGGKAGIVGGINPLDPATMRQELSLSGWIEAHSHAFKRPNDGALFRGPFLAYMIMCGVSPEETERHCVSSDVKM